MKIEFEKCISDAILEHIENSKILSSYEVERIYEQRVISIQKLWKTKFNELKKIESYLWLVLGCMDKPALVDWSWKYARTIERCNEYGAKTINKWKVKAVKIQ